MRVEQRRRLRGSGVVVARRARRVGVALAVAVAIGLIGSCRHIARDGESSLSRAVALEPGDELAVVMSQLGARARRTVSRADSIRVAIHFDPEMIEVENVASYTLWGRGSESSEWRRIREFSVTDLPAEMSFREGTFGLRASAKYRDGTEVFIPLPTDEPVVWLIVDRSPPSLTWLRPAANAPVEAQGPVELVWTTNEVETGTEPSVIEWSADGGQTWNLIAKVEPRAGHQSHDWSVPRGLHGPCQIRVTARDLVGHATSSVVDVDLVSSLAGGAIAAAGAPGSSLPEAVPVPSAAHDDGGPSGNAGSGVSAAGSVVRAAGPLHLEPFAVDFVRGGESIEVRWSYAGTGGELAVEWSRDGGTTWELVATSSASAGSVTWKVPAVDVPRCLLRARMTKPSGDSSDGSGHISRMARPFGIDAAPPRVSFESVPEVVGPTARFDLSWDDGEGSGLSSARVFLRSARSTESRPDPGRAWRTAPASIVHLDLGREGSRRAALTLDLQSVAEGSYEIYLEVVDRVGNHSEAPRSGTASMAVFLLDKTPPHLVVTPYPLSWVEGMTADIQIDADWRDVAFPVILYGRGSSSFGGGDASQQSWRELARWTRLPPNTRQFSWTVPTGLGELSVKVEARDRAGNVSSRVINERRVEPAIYLKDLARGTVLDGGRAKLLLWELHSAAVQYADELRVDVEHQRGPGRPWETICENLTVLEQCLWEVPRGDESDEHRVRLRLTRGGQLVSEYRSEPFAIRPGRPEFQEPLIPQDSLDYLTIARKFVEKYLEARRELAGKTITREAQDHLDELVQRAKESFRKSLELAENNYHAAYAYAQFLNRLPERDDGQVEALLRQVVQFKPTHHWAYKDLGALYIRMQKYEDAETALRTAAELEPSADVHYNLGLALFQQATKMPEARAQFEAALASPRDGRAHEGVLYYYVICTYLQEGRVNEARAIYRDRSSTIPAELRDRLRQVFDT